MPLFVIEAPILRRTTLLSRLLFLPSRLGLLLGFHRRWAVLGNKSPAHIPALLRLGTLLGTLAAALRVSDR